MPVSPISDHFRRGLGGRGISNIEQVVFSNAGRGWGSHPGLGGLLESDGSPVRLAFPAYSFQPLAAQHSEGLWETYTQRIGCDPSASTMAWAL